jgi:hypothetical protein
MHGSLLFICGLALGFVFRSRGPRSGDTRPVQQSETASHAWHDLPSKAATWTDTTWIDGDAAFSPQLVNLHHALQPTSVEAVCTSAKTRAPLCEAAHQTGRDPG